MAVLLNDLIVFTVIRAFLGFFTGGFMFSGLKSSRIGPIGAIILTSLIWAGLHTQYDLYGMCQIFAGGLLLGYARLKSGSIFVPLAMHALMNLIATIEVVVQMNIMEHS